MSLKIENCKPVSVYVDSPRTLAEIRTLLPDAIEILANYGINYSANSCYHYRVLMPYKFTAPSQPAFGDRLEVAVVDPYSNGVSTIGTSLELLAQDVAYIMDYSH